MSIRELFAKKSASPTHEGQQMAAVTRNTCSRVFLAHSQNIYVSLAHITNCPFLILCNDFRIQDKIGE